MASFATEPPPASPNAKSRRRAGAFIAAFVLFQFLAPLSYLGREDASDERFTWRRFTRSDEVACETSAWVERADGERRDIALESTIHQQWVDYVQRDRRAVVDAFLQKQCEAPGVLRVELVNHCDDARGTREYSLRCAEDRSATIRTATR
ncbi:MAG: hypothetical protein AMJ62_01860 [Myxococcales bacterium SG8_38]|nr:MAG: hypothetical protein AMJ62_01860 [Myxococcales bacterium SG8_38]